MYEIPYEAMIPSSVRYSSKAVSAESRNRPEADTQAHAYAQGSTLSHYLNELGKPHVELAGLKLWVHSYQYRNADDYDDANWLNATAICSEKGATVLVEGAFIRTTEIFAWQRAVEELAANLLGEARLECMEPDIAVTLKGCPSAQLRCKYKSRQTS